MADEFEKVTPMPWTCEDSDSGADPDEWVIRDARGNVVIDGVLEDAATLIVRAVNAYGPMREALQELRASFGQNASEERLKSFAEVGMVLSIDPLTVAKLMRALRAANGKE